jgi:hypothetical protein
MNFCPIFLIFFSGFDTGDYHELVPSNCELRESDALKVNIAPRFNIVCSIWAKFGLRNLHIASLQK